MKMMHIRDLLTLTSFIIATTIKLALFANTSVANFIITKNCRETFTKSLHPIA